MIESSQSRIGSVTDELLLYCYHYDPATGKEIWIVGYDEGFSNVPRPVYGHGLVYIATGFQEPSLIAVRPSGTGDVTATHVAWSLTRGAIYWHFKSKADLYNTLVEEVSARGAAVVQGAVAEGGTLIEILRRVFVRQCALIEEDKEARAVMELALFKTGLDPDLQAGRKKQLEAGNALIAGITDAMRQGIAQGLLRNDLDPADMARAFIAFENGVIYLWLASPKSFSLKASADSFADILIAGLRA